MPHFGRAEAHFCFAKMMGGQSIRQAKVIVLPTNSPTSLERQKPRGRKVASHANLDVTAPFLQSE